MGSDQRVVRDDLQEIDLCCQQLLDPRVPPLVRVVQGSQPVVVEIEDRVDGVAGLPRQVRYELSEAPGSVGTGSSASTGSTDSTESMKSSNDP